MPSIAELADVLAEIKAWHGIYDASNQDAITNKEIIRWLNTARAKLMRKYLLRFSEVAGLINLTQWSDTGDLPDRWLGFTDMFIYDAPTDPTRHEIKWYRSIRRFAMKYPSTTTVRGTPKAAAQWGNTILFGPGSDGDHVVVWRGHCIPADYVSGGYSDHMMANARDALVFGALVISAEFHTVPEAKQSKWEQYAAEQEAIVRKTYRTSKTSYSKIVCHDPGTIVVPDEEED